MQPWFDRVLRHRTLTLTVILVLTLAAGGSLSRAHLGSSIQRIFFGESPNWDRYRDLARTFGNDEAFVVGWSDSDPLSVVSLDRLQAAVAAVEAHPDVARVDSLLTAPWVRNVDGALRVDSYADAARNGESAAAALADDDLLAGLLVSRRGDATAVLVELTDTERSGEQGPAIFSAVMARFVAAGFPREHLHAAGFPPLLSEIVRQSYVNLAAVFPMSALLLVGTVWWMFRRLLPVLITSGVSLIAVLWTMGFGAAIDPELSLFMTITPVVILIVGFADVVHLYSAYISELRLGRSRDEAILASATDVGRACLFTSLTTFVGFLSLSAVPTPMFRLLAFVLAFGVAVALLLAMTLTPVVLSFLPAPDLAPAGRPGATDRALDAVLGGCMRLASRRPWAVIGTWTAVLAVSVIGSSQARVETDMLARLSPDNPVRLDDEWFTSHFSGTNTFEVYISTPEPDGVLDADVFSGIAAAQDAIAALPGVDRVASLVDVVGSVHRSLGGDGPLPSSREGLAQVLLLFELSGGEGLDRVVDFERRMVKLSVRTGPGGFRSVFRSSRLAEQAARDALGAPLVASGVKVESTGLIPLLGWWLDRILLGQKMGFLASFVIIAGLMARALRSWRVGLWSMVPNTLPLLVLAGFLGFAWNQIDSDAFVIALLAIGIGVDDTIHFLVRYRVEADRSQSTDEAISKTFAFAGRAIVITSVILVVGFLPFAFTAYFTTWMFGTLLPMVLVVALSADLLLVPAMVSVGWMEFGKPRGQAGRLLRDAPTNP